MSSGNLFTHFWFPLSSELQEGYPVGLILLLKTVFLTKGSFLKFLFKSWRLYWEGTVGRMQGESWWLHGVLWLVLLLFQVVKQSFQHFHWPTTVALYTPPHNPLLFLMALPHLGWDVVVNSTFGCCVLRNERQPKRQLPHYTVYTVCAHVAKGQVLRIPARGSEPWDALCPCERCCLPLHVLLGVHFHTVELEELRKHLTLF